MAEMYVELGDQYELETTEKGVTGTRVFRRDDTNGTVAAASLPVVGTSLMVDRSGSNVTGCVARRKREIWAGGHEGTPEIAYTYDTEDANNPLPGSSITQDDDHEEFDLSVSRETFHPDPNVASGDYWKITGAAEALDEPLPVAILQGSFSKPFPNKSMTSAQKDTLLARLKTYARTINTAAFEGFAVGQVMFTGVSGGSFRTSSGAKRYRFMLHFEFRILGDDMTGTAITQDDWLYIASAQAAKFVKPVTNTTSKNLYKKSDFSTGGLFAPL
jgi:hypothetical protein